MKHRKPAAVFFLSLITLGIYSLVWHVKTKNEMNKLGASIPTAWLLIVPLANLYWIWKYAEGVEKVSGGKVSAVLALILLLLLSIVGIAILQSEYNKLTVEPAAVSPDPVAPAPVAPQTDTLAAAVPPMPVDQTEPSPFAVPQPPAEPTPPTVITPTEPSSPEPPAPPAPPTPPTVI